MIGPGLFHLMSAAVCLNGAPGGDSPAQPAQPPHLAGAAVVSSAADLDMLVAELGAAELTRREAASEQLAARMEFTLADLEKRLRAGELSAEQRMRLLAAARARFAASPRAAMGVEFDSMQPLRAVIARTMPNFPAAAVLQKDDEIVEVAGQAIAPTDGWGAVRPKILSHDPGDTLDMAIRRRNEVVRLSVPLGRFNDLQNAQFGALDLTLAWAERAARIAGTASPLSVQSGNESWHPGTGPLGARAAGRVVDASGMFAIGAHARGGRPMMDVSHAAMDLPDRVPMMPGVNPRAVIQQEIWINGRRVQPPQNNQGVVIIGPNGGAEVHRQPDGVDARLINEYQRLIVSRSRIEGDILMLAQRLGDARLAESERKAAQELVQKRQTSLREVEQRIAIIEARLRKDAQQQEAPKP